MQMHDLLYFKKSIRLFFCCCFLFCFYRSTSHRARGVMIGWVMPQVGIVRVGNIQVSNVRGEDCSGANCPRTQVLYCHELSTIWPCLTVASRYSIFHIYLFWLSGITYTSSKTELHASILEMTLFVYDMPLGVYWLNIHFKDYDYLSTKGCKISLTEKWMHTHHRSLTVQPVWTNSPDLNICCVLMSSHLLHHVLCAWSSRRVLDTDKVSMLFINMSLLSYWVYCVSRTVKCTLKKIRLFLTRWKSLM